MATMLAFFTTDATIDAALLQDALRRRGRRSLNRITVDGDTSTNDMAVVLASGAAARPRSPGPAPTSTRSGTR
jgi:glutamate N-acetyltransferase/amino-acid N-acetyltransferase